MSTTGVTKEDTRSLDCSHTYGYRNGDYDGRAYRATGTCGSRDCIESRQ